MADDKCRVPGCTYPPATGSEACEGHTLKDIGDERREQLKAQAKKSIGRVTKTSAHKQDGKNGWIKPAMRDKIEAAAAKIYLENMGEVSSNQAGGIAYGVFWSTWRNL